MASKTDPTNMTAGTAPRKTGSNDSACELNVNQNGEVDATSAEIVNKLFDEYAPTIQVVLNKLEIEAIVTHYCEHLATIDDQSDLRKVCLSCIAQARFARFRIRGFLDRGIISQDDLAEIERKTSSGFFDVDY